MTASAWKTPDGSIPTCITRCCREWISPAFTPGGRCGHCNKRPAFVRMLPESEWVTPRPPIRPPARRANDQEPKK